VEQRKRVFFKWLVLGKGGFDDVGREPADSSDNAVSVAMAHWKVEHSVFTVEQFILETVIPYLLANVFSVGSSMLSVEVQFQIETLYCDGWTVTTESLFLKKLLDDKHTVLYVPMRHGY